MSTPQILTPSTLLTHSQPSIDNANNLIGQARRAEITTQEHFDSAIDAIKVCTAQEKRANEALHRLIDPLTAHIKWIRLQFKAIFDTLAEAKKIFSDKAMAWKRVEDARLAAIADEERRLAEEQALRDAEAAQKAGDSERANALIDLAASTPEADTQVRGRGQFTGASGSSKFTWKGEIDDVLVVCRAIADGHLSPDMIKEFSKSALNAYAENRKVEGVFYGIKCFEKEDLYVR